MDLLKRKFRLTKTQDFLKVKKHGQRVMSPLFLLNYLKSDKEVSRFGFIVTKAIGQSVVRHRAIRLLRESVRLIFDQIKPGYDVVILARSRMVGKIFAEMEEEMRRLLGKAGLLKTQN